MSESPKAGTVSAFQFAPLLQVFSAPPSPSQILSAARIEMLLTMMLALQTRSPRFARASLLNAEWRGIVECGVAGRDSEGFIGFDHETRAFRTRAHCRFL